MSQDFDKKEWQEHQATIDATYAAQKAKADKAKVRAARNAQRKIDRLRAKLKDAGDLTDWEDEFSESVSERLEKFGSAFADPEKGRRSDALSFAQKKVVAALKKKAKGDTGGSSFKQRSGFKSKTKPKFTPRVRHIEDDMDDAPSKDAPFIPEYVPETRAPTRPFLRVVGEPE